MRTKSPPRDRPPRVRVNVLVDPWMRDYIEALSRRRHTSVSREVRSALAFYVTTPRARADLAEIREPFPYVDDGDPAIVPLSVALDDAEAAR